MQITTKPLRWFKRGKHARIDPGRLKPNYGNSANQLKVRQLHALFAQPDGTIITGYRQFLAAELVGLESLDVKIPDAELSDADVKACQLVENMHRRDLTDYEKWVAFTDWLAMRPDAEQKDLAAEVALDASTITRYTTMSMLIPEVQEAFKNGLFGIGVGYSIAKKKAGRSARHSSICA